MQDSYSIWKKIKTLIFPAIPTLLALILVGIYAQGVFPQLTLEAVHLACLFFISLELIPGVTERVNDRKAEFFACALIISMAVLGLALEWSLRWPLELPSVWAVVWCGLFLVSLVCLVMVMVRMLRWSQQDWEQAQQTAREKRREDKETRRERRRRDAEEKRTRRNAAAEKRREQRDACRQYWTERFNSWRAYRKERAEIRHEKGKERIEHGEELKTLQQRYEIQEEEARRKHKAQLKEIRENYEAQLEEERQTYEARLEQEREEFESRRASMRTKCNEKLEQEWRRYADAADAATAIRIKSPGHSKGNTEERQSYIDQDQEKLGIDGDGKSHKSIFRRIYESKGIDLFIAVVILALFIVILYFFPFWMQRGIELSELDSQTVNSVDEIQGDTENQRNVRKPENNFEKWVAAAINLMSQIEDANKNDRPDKTSGNNPEKGDSPLLILATYIALMAVGILSILLLLYILWAFIRKMRLGKEALLRENDDPQNFNFFDAYAVPIALLLISLLGLYSITTDDFALAILSNSWARLLFSIVLILLLLTAFEMVRLTLEECGRPESLFRRIVKLIFIELLEFLTQIIFGVFRGLQIESLITSLFSLLLPGDKDGLAEYIIEKLKRMFQCEVDKVSGCKGGSFANLSRHRIWKKGRPQ